MPFQIIRNDITKVKADAIVNTANPKPVCGGGTDTAIYEAAGKVDLLLAREKIGNIARGEAVETPAFKLDAKYIIHTVGPVWEGGNKGEFDTLRSCYEKSLRLALKLKCKSIAFPLISTGIYGFPKDKALQIAMAAIQEFLLENDMKVILVVFDRKAFELSGKIVDNIREYVDANYIQAANEREYFGGSSLRSSVMNVRDRTSGRNFRGSIEDEDLRMARANLVEDDEPRMVRANLVEPAVAHNIMPSEDSIPESIEDSFVSCDERFELREAGSGKPSVSHKKVDIGHLIGNSDKTFQEKLFEIIDERGLTGPQVYKNYVSKQVFSKIQADKYYHPNKYTAIALCLSLHLTVEQTQDLIGRAGWTLSPSSRADLVVKGCIINQEYNVVKINCILFDFDCPELEKIK